MPGGLGTTTISYGYDALYRLTDAAYTGAITATFVYDYDSVGNMTAFTETVDAQTTSVSRTFDRANRLEYAVDASGTTTYTYDANGNLIELLPPGATGANPVGGVRYDYDQRNLMVSQETNPDGTAWILQAEYVYDGGNDRLQQVDYTDATPITTTYTNDSFGLTQVLVADDGTNQVYNLFGLDLINQDSGVEVRTLLVDGLGSVRQEMVGSVVETATTYSPYGEVLEQAGMSGTVYGFTGEQEDDATGLLYLRARYYDSSLKAFMSRDPWEGTGRRPATLNYYVYVRNNPSSRTDPSGRCEEYNDESCWEIYNQIAVLVSTNPGRFLANRSSVWNDPAWWAELQMRSEDDLRNIYNILTSSYKPSGSEPYYGSRMPVDFTNIQVGFSLVTIGIMRDAYGSLYGYYGISVGLEDLVLPMPIEFEITGGDIIAEQVPGAQPLWQWYDKEAPPQELESILTGASFGVSGGLLLGCDLSGTLTRAPSKAGLQIGFYSPQVGAELIIDSFQLYNAGTDKWSSPAWPPTWWRR